MFLRLRFCFGKPRFSASSCLSLQFGGPYDLKVLLDLKDLILLLLLFSFSSCCENRRDDFQVPYMSYQKLEVRTSVFDCFILASVSTVLLAFLDVQLTCSTLWLALGILSTISSFLHIWLLWTRGSWMYHLYKTWKQELNFFFLFMFCCYMTIYCFLRLLSKRRLISLWPKSVS